MTLYSKPSVREEEFVNQGKTSKVERYGWKLKDKSKPGVLIEIPKHELNIDPSYQRPKTSESKILRLAQNWSWLACGALLVADRDNTYFVIDGQHRLKASLRREDIKELPCLVFETVSAVEEAKGFLDANTERKPVSGYDKFRALVAIQDPAALVVYRLCSSSGREIGHSRGRVVGVISCVSTLLRHAKDTPFMLERIWPLMMDITSAVPLQKQLVEGLMYIETHMRNGESLTDKKWRSRVMRAGAAGLVEQAGKAMGFYGKSGPRILATGMLQAMNHGCRVRLIIRGQEDEE